MSSDESRIHYWYNQQKYYVLSTLTHSTSLDYQNILTLLPIYIVNLGDLGHPRIMEQNPKGARNSRKNKKVGSHDGD